MQQIGFKNFRKFEEFPTVKINDLTFLVGSNNAGKSTMVKAVLLVYDNLKNLRSIQKNGQSETPMFKFDANKKRDLHIGTFWRALNSKAKRRGDNHITFDVTLSNIRYEIVITCNNDNTDDLYETMSPVERLIITDNKNRVRVIIDYANNLLKAEVDIENENCHSTEDRLDKFVIFAYNNDFLNRIYALSTVWEGHADLLKTVIRDIQNSLNDTYIEYFYAHGVTQKVVYSYEDKNDYIASIIHDYENESELFTKEEEQFTPYWLKRFGIGTGIKIKSVSGAAFSVYILNEDNPKEGINFVDLGMGYIQLILLFMKLNTFISRNRQKETKTSLIVIEEPEQNLHPRLQSMLTELFESLHKKHDIRFLVETHSEYIIRATQVKVGDAEYDNQEQLEKENPFTVYYFPENGLPYDMNYTTTGKFVNEFQSGFFDEAGRQFMKVLKRERKIK